MTTDDYGEEQPVLARRLIVYLAETREGERLRGKDEGERRKDEVN